MCAFLAAIAAVNQYGSAEFGAISVAQQVALFAVVIASLGMDMHAVRHVVRQPDSMGAVASTVILGRILLGVVMYLVALLAAMLIPPLREILALVAVAGLSLFTQAITVLWVAQAVQRPHVHGLVHLGTQALFLGLVHGAIQLGLGSWAVPAALVAAQALAALALLVWMRRTVGPLGRPLPRGETRRFLDAAAPYGGSNILRGLATASDLILLGILLGKTAEVGWYSGVTRLYLFGHGMLSVYFVVFFPILVERAAQGRLALGGELRRSLVRTTPPVLLAAGVSIWFAGDILVLLFPDDFLGATSSLQYVSAAMLASILAAQFRHALLAMNHQVADLRNTALAALVHVGLKAWLIVRLGIEGAALGTLAGELTFLLLSFLSCGAAFSHLRAMETGAQRDGD